MELKKEVQSFWDSQPCGTKFTRHGWGTPDFFRSLEEHRYRLEPHIAELAAFPATLGKRVLEIGCGLGTDGVQFAKAGASYVGLDLSLRSVPLAKKNFEWQDLSASLLVSDAESLPIRDDSVDVVYSHGVLHHTPRVQEAVNEIHRVLRPGGLAVVMLYHRSSFNYYVGILFLRRLGALLLYSDWGVQLLHRLTGDRLAHLQEHSRRLRAQGWRYLMGGAWLNNNTDGVGNPLSRVFTRKEVSRLFGQFSRVRTQVRFLHMEWFPLFGKLLPRSTDLALGKVLGWHLYVLAET